MKAILVMKPYLHLTDEAKARLIGILKTFEEVLFSPTMSDISSISMKTDNLVPIEEIDSIGYVQSFDVLAEKANSSGVEVAVTVGGDGIASYMASAIIKKGFKIKVLGFPAGTANVGPIVKKFQDFNSLKSSELLDAIEVSCAGKVLGYGFNDVMFGYNFLGTKNGNWVNLNARDMALNGQSVEDDMTEGSPVTESFEVRLDDNPISVVHNVVGGIKQICVSTLYQENLYGRAILGGLSEGCGESHPAAIALLDKVANDARLDAWATHQFRNTCHLCFTERNVIRLSGFRDGACVIIDGNPFIIEEDCVYLRCVPDCISVFGAGGKV